MTAASADCIERMYSDLPPNPPNVAEQDYSPWLSSLGQPEAREALVALNKIFPKVNLSNIQTIVFVHSWQGETYQKIAKGIGYDADYIKDVGHKLWKQLSESLGENISKKNLSSIVRKHYLKLEEERRQGNNLLPFSQYQDRDRTKQTHYDWGESPLIPIFVERQPQQQQLETWILKENKQLVGLFGFGGVGKTTLAVKFAERMEGYFDHVIWRSLRNPKPFADFVTDLVETISQTPVTSLSPDPAVQINLLLKTLKKFHCLLILDDWFSVLQPQKLVGVYHKQYDAYGFFLRRVSESRTNSCVMVTSREKPGGLAFKEHQNSCVRSLFLSGVALNCGQSLLVEYGLHSGDPHLYDLVKLYGGNPYFLRIVSHTILSLFGGSVANFIKREELIYGDIRSLFVGQFNRLTQLEKLIINCMADLREWISIIELEENLEKLDASESLDSLLEAIESLFCRSFIIQKQGQINLPPLLRQYVCSLKESAQPKSSTKDWFSPLLGE